MRLRSWASATVLATAFLAIIPANAQNVTTIISPAIAPDFARDRNVSVTERPHPDFDALGVRTGSFLTFPSVAISAGATDNAYLDNALKRSDVYAVVNPAVRVQSDWNNHRLVFEGSADLRRYATETVRNQNGWVVGTSGRVDVTSTVAIGAQAQIAKAYENPFTDDAATNVAVLSNYVRKSALVRTTYTAGRVRLSASADALSFRFNTLRFDDDTVRSQAFRNRDTWRGAAQAEYAISPSVTYFAQINVDKTDYKSPLDGLPNRTSVGVLAIAGSNFDIPGVMRGSAGIGYTWRNYDAARFIDRKGLSFQTKLDFFVSPITTLGVSAQRVIQDASIGNGAAFIDTRLAIQADHELLENLLLNAGVSFIRQHLPDTGANAKIWRANTGARLQMTRSLGLGATVAYGSARPSNVSLGRKFNEWSGLLSVTLRL